MNRYFMLRRLMWPSILLLLGIIALLHQAHLAHWSLFVPLLLILIGVLKLAEHAALAAEPYPPQPYPDSIAPPAAAASPQDPGSQSADSVPAQRQYPWKDSDGGQS